jgi:PAS domain S-box-containing protein
MKGSPYPLRYTVPGIILGGGALIVLAASLHQFSTTARRGVEQLREHALFVATTSAAELEADGRAGSPSRWAGTVHRLATDRRLRLAVFAGPHDTVLAASAFHLERQPLPPVLAALLEQARATAPGPGREAVLQHAGAGLLTTVVPVELVSPAPGSRAAMGWLLLQFDTSTDTAVALRDALGRAAVLLLIVIAGSVLLLGYFRYAVTARVERLVATADAVAAGEDVRALRLEGRDELAVLSTALQRMAERLRAGELQLANTGREFRRLIERGGDFIVTLDYDGRIDFVSPIAEQVLGQPADRLRGLPLMGMMPPEEADRLQAVLTRTYAEGGTSDSLDVRLRAGEDWVTLEVVATCPADWRGTGRLVLNARDVTRRVALELELRQAQKMEALGQLAGGVAHDFNNLLTGILGGSDLLLAESELAAGVREDVLEIRRCAEQASQLTRQLLAFSRREAPQPEPVDLNALVEDAERLLGRLLSDRVALATELSPAPIRVLADRSQLQQVIINLVVNARDAMPDGGTVRVESAAVPVGATVPEEVQALGAGPWARLAVEDGGTGIPPEVVARIFEPFFTTKAEGKGTGLGLSTVWGIVQLLGGVTRVESRPGRTRFEIWLPHDASSGPVASEPKGPAAPAPGAAPEVTVLLVEDDPAVRRTARRILERDGYQVLVAETGEEALERLRAHPQRVDLLITDLVMPGMGGAELMRQVADGRLPPRILFMSGYDAGAAERGEIPAAAEFLPKPFTLAEFQEKVRQVLSGRGGRG